MGDDLEGRAPRGGWNIAWRLIVLLAIAGMWFSPNSWHHQARHSAFYFILQTLIASLALGLAPIMALIEAIDLIALFRKRKGTHGAWIKVRLCWLVVVIIHLIAVAIALKLWKMFDGLLGIGWGAMSIVDWWSERYPSCTS